MLIFFFELIFSKPLPDRSDVGPAPGGQVEGLTPTSDPGLYPLFESINLGFKVQYKFFPNRYTVCALCAISALFGVMWQCVKTLAFGLIPQIANLERFMINPQITNLRISTKYCTTLSQNSLQSRLKKNYFVL